jgi:hypothetical protein
MKFNMSTAAAACTVCLVAASVAPSANAAVVQPLPKVAVSSQQYSLLASDFDFITYAGNVTRARKAVAVNTTALQTELPLMLIFAPRNPESGEFSAVELIGATSASAQDLVTALTAIPGLSDAPEIQYALAGIGWIGTAVEDVTRDTLGVIEPYVSPARLVYNVVITGSRAYHVVIAFPQALVADVIAGGGGANAIDDVADSFANFVQAVNNLRNTAVPTTKPEVEAVGKQPISAASMLRSGATDTVRAGQPDGLSETAAGLPQDSAAIAGDSADGVAAQAGPLSTKDQPSDSDADAPSDNGHSPTAPANADLESPNGKPTVDGTASGKAQRRDPRRSATDSVEKTQTRDNGTAASRSHRKGRPTPNSRSGSGATKSGDSAGAS